MSGVPPRMRQPREIIERLPGGYLVDCDGTRSIEKAEMVASRILRIWPDVAIHVAAAWRPGPSPEETVE